tara:strand:- start:80 stop:280 length:201 start_codon:yes stop_codon:yes gene_type:complete
MKDGKPAGSDQSLVDGLRLAVKIGNLACGERQYVKLQGRGPRPSNRYHQSLPLNMATSADVYIYSR